MTFDPQADRRKNFAMTSNNLGQGRVQLSTWDNEDDREGAKQRWLDMISPSEPAWIFAYGSLMWDPGFVFEAVEPATVFGYHRRFCIYSHIYRGTPQHPGLVLGLDRGGSCQGRAFQIAPSAAREVLGMVWDREMIYRVYLPRDFYAHIGNRRVLCRTFVANPNHEQYAGRMSNREAAQMIAGATGKAGPNNVYLENTLHHLQSLGLKDGGLRRLQSDVQRITGER